MLKITVVGCGQIADAHIQEVQKLPGVQLVAVCDQIPDLARQAAERFGVAVICTNMGEMIENVRPDVVHITTPPQTHARLAIQALSSGCHVYVEKPFAVDLAEAETVLAAAAAANRLVCVGHDQLFDPCWSDLLNHMRRGRLGKVVHVDSVMGYNLSGPYGRQMLNDPTHWVHRLPGGLFQNNISHAVYKVTEFLLDSHPVVRADWSGSNGGPPTELRVALRGRDVTANVIFTSTARPLQRVARVYGTLATVEADLDGRLLRWSRSTRSPGAFAKIEMPVRQFAEAGATLLRNAWRFFRSDLQYFAGMNRLFRAFYQAIQTGGPSPTPPDDIRRVTAIMDNIFATCRKNEEAESRVFIAKGVT